MTLQQLHGRLAHFNSNYIEYMGRNGMSDGIVITNQREFKNGCCDACRASKATRNNPTRVREDEPKSKAPFEYVYADVKGPLEADFWGNRYVVTFNDEFSRWSAVYFCKTKDEVAKRFQDFLRWTKTKGWTVKVLTTDSGGEFTYVLCQ